VARANMNRTGTMTIMRRLYSQARRQTIELLVIRFSEAIAKVD
jgi:hypothetical protein